MQIDGYTRGFGITHRKLYAPSKDKWQAVSSGKMPEYSQVYGDIDQYMYQMEFYGIEHAGYDPQ